MNVLTPHYQTLQQHFCHYLQTLGFATTTVYDFNRFIFYFLLFLQQQYIPHINQLTKQHVHAYFNYLQYTTGNRTKKAFSTAHLNRIFLAIDKFLEFLHHLQATHTLTPTKFLLEHVPQKNIHILTPQEIQQLYHAVNTTFLHLPLKYREPKQYTLQLVLDLCYGCAMRRSEALNLQIHHINFDQQTIHIKQGKNYKDRIIPLNTTITNNLQVYIYQYRKNFATRKNYVYPLKTYAIAHALKLLVQNCTNLQIQNKQPTLHTLRHSLATHLLQNGMPIEHIAQFLGHTTLSSTQMYTHIVNGF